MEEMIKELAPPTVTKTLEEVPVELPVPVEPNTNLRDAGIVIGVFVVAAICYKLYLATAKVKND